MFFSEHIRQVLNPASSVTTSTNLCRGIQVGPVASAQTVTLAHSEQRRWQNRSKVIEGPAAHALSFLCDTTSLRGILGEQLGQQGFFCVAVAAKCSSHAEQSGNNIPAHEDCRQESRNETFFTLKDDDIRCFGIYIHTFVMIIRCLAHLLQCLHDLHHGVQDLENKTVEIKTLLSYNVPQLDNDT